MKRLTAKLDEDLYAVEMPKGISKEEAQPILMKNFKDCCTKLGRIEDLEEEIGMSLEFILTKVIGHEIYTIIQKPFKDKYIANDRASRIGRDYDDYRGRPGCWLITTENCLWVLTSDYRKTWWLEKEEAEKALEELKKCC